MPSNAYVHIHKDLSQVKTKVFFSLTARQLVCFGSGILVGVPLFFVLRQVLPGSAAATLMILVMLPFFLFGLYERNGQPLEKVLRCYVLSRFVRPQRRPYRTENAYAALMRQAKIEKEAMQIVQKQRKQKRSQSEADPC